ncbi:Uncharacterised protein [Mycobacteroides abscessus subsp. abscessus]|nr:Uncharacterised protein [Mycobacteroides abscessus subsp. abscessus]
MPHDYLKWVVAPLPYPVLWLVLGVIMIFLVIGWCVGIFVWTMPVEKLRSIPVVRDISARVLRFTAGARCDEPGAAYVHLHAYWRARAVHVAR